MQVGWHGCWSEFAIAAHSLVNLAMGEAACWTKLCTLACEPVGAHTCPISNFKNLQTLFHCKTIFFCMNSEFIVRSYVQTNIFATIQNNSIIHFFKKTTESWNMMKSKSDKQVPPGEVCVSDSL